VDIKISASNPLWPKIFEQEASKIKSSLRKCKLYHIGSTSVPNLASKPIIDIIAEVDDITLAYALLMQIGYRYKGEYNLPLIPPDDPSCKHFVLYEGAKLVAAACLKIQDNQANIIAAKGKNLNYLLNFILKWWEIAN